MRLLLAALVSGCAIHPFPAAQLAESQAAIARAEKSGAAEYAPVELRSAREKLELTRRWIAAKDYEPARWLAEQALVDAELAQAKAMSARSRAAGRTW
jgi:hypothetical protein